jgi:hypothetical protein
MTVQQAIERADQMRQGNAVPDELKLEWLSECEGYIWNETIRMHFGSHRYKRYRETERNEYIFSEWNGDWSSTNAPDVVLQMTEGNYTTRIYKLHDGINETPDKDYPYGVDFNRVNVRYKNTTDEIDEIAPLSKYGTCEYGATEVLVTNKVIIQEIECGEFDVEALYCFEAGSYEIGGSDPATLDKGIYVVSVVVDDGEDVLLFAPIPIEEIIDEKTKTEIIPAWKYTEEDTDVELIAYAPYDMLYVYWLMAKIDLFSQELDNYNASLNLFLNEKQQYKNHYHTHNKTIPNPQMRV